MRAFLCARRVEDVYRGGTGAQLPQLYSPAQALSSRQPLAAQNLERLASERIVERGAGANPKFAGEEIPYRIADLRAADDRLHVDE
jgi:hypothetical protein